MKAYAIKDPTGYMLYFSVNTSENLAWLEVLDGKLNNKEDYLKMGYRCVPVTITEVKTDK